jgi:hypothetical protein
MTNIPKPPAKSNIDPELYKRLRAEAKKPFRSVRRFFYLGFAASGFIGGVVFFARTITGRDLDTNLPNLALQAGVVALMLFLLKIDRNRE